MLTLSVAIALAVVFTILLFALRSLSLDRRFSELERCVQVVIKEWKGRESLVEVHEDFPEIEFAVSNPSGQLLAATTKNTLPKPTGRVMTNHRLYVGAANSEIVVVGSISWSETEEELRELTWVLAGLWIALVFVTAGITWYAAGVVLRPVTELVKSADQLTTRTETGLLETSDHAEFAALAESLNQLIERVRRAAKVQEQFASDAAHELRSPLALLRTRIETTLLNDRTVDQYREDLRSMIPKVDRLTSIVETLLASARAANAVVTVIDLDSSLRGIVGQWGLDWEWNANLLDIETVSCQAAINFEELRIVVVNLLDNAAKHSPLDQPITIRLQLDGPIARLSVHNQGPTLSVEGQAHAFERFYRSDEDRSRDAGGAGIGLSVVRRIVESRGGEVGFEQVASGTKVFALIPVV